MPRIAYTARPQHYSRRRLRAVCTVDEAGIPGTAAAVVKRIQRNRRTSSAGSYVLVDDEGRVYVVPEAAAWAEAMVNRHAGWLVGRYASGARVVFPDARDIEGDILERLVH